jgi:hypothetical protein
MLLHRAGRIGKAKQGDEGRGENLEQQWRPMLNADQSEFSPAKITNDSSQMMGHAAELCLASTSARACAAF